MTLLLSSRLAAKLCDVNFCHSLQQITFAGKSAGRTELRTHSLFKCLQEPGCVERGLRLFLFLLFHSHKSLLMSGGAITAFRYCSSPLVDLRHLVIGSMW